MVPALPSDETRLGFLRPAAKPEHLARFSWRLFAFEVRRRPGKVTLGAPVAPRRVLVYAPYPEAAQAGAGAAHDELSREVPTRLHERIGAGRRPRRDEVADFYETLGQALSTGCGLTLALNMASRTARSPRIRGIIGTVADLVMHGEDLHVAMRCFPRVFLPMQLAMVEAAAATGLDQAGALLVTVAVRLQKDGKVWRKFTGAIAYPLSLLGLTVVGAIVLELWALPPMVELFHTLGGRLPPITAAFYAIAQFLRESAWLLVGAASAAAITMAWAAPRLLQSRLTQRMAVKAWAIGPIVQWIALCRALSTFVLLKESGAKVRDQFALAAAAAGNCVVGDFFEACYRRIALGESVEEAFTAERHRLGDDGVRLAGRMEVAMAGADLPQLINRIVDELSDRTESRVALLPNLLRWPLLIVCCAVIGVVALAIVLPYPNLIADVAQQQTGLKR